MFLLLVYFQCVRYVNVDKKCALFAQVCNLYIFTSYRICWHFSTKFVFQNNRFTSPLPPSPCTIPMLKGELPSRYSGRSSFDYFLF